LNKVKLRNGIEEDSTNVTLVMSMLEMMFEHEHAVFVELVDHARTNTPLSAVATTVLDEYDMLEGDRVYSDILSIADAMADQDGDNLILVHPVTGQSLSDGNDVSGVFYQASAEGGPVIQLGSGDDKRFWMPAVPTIQ